MENKVLTISLKNDFKKFERKINTVAGKILKILKKENVSVEIYLSDNSLMRSLNRKLRGKDKVADVLSFEYPKEFIQIPSDRRITRNKDKRGKTQKMKPLGEIYLNAEMKDRNFSQEFLLLHGVLHLLGYDHAKESDAIKMEAKEKSVCKKLNIIK